MSLLCVIGVIEYQEEDRGFKNWFSQSSDSIKHKEWLEINLPAEFQEAFVILEIKSGNILTPKSMAKVWDIEFGSKVLPKTQSSIC